MSGAAQRKSSLVDYSKVSDRPVQDARFAKKHQPAAASALAAAPSAQMDAVMRLMTGREERTIAEKLADSNRPTWEQYKKDNQDKLNLDGLDQKQMEEYRQQLDAERDKRMAGGGAADRKKKSKKKKKRKKRRRDDESSDNGNSDSEASSSGLESSDERRRRRKHKKRHKHKKKRHHSDTDEDDEADRKKKTRHAKMKDKEGGDDESDGDHYRLSNVFAEGADE